MASSLASIAETWPENVLTSIVSRKSHCVQKIIARPYSDILGAGGYFCAFAQFFAGIGPAHFPAETTRPLGRGCLPFSPSFSRCKVTKSKFGTVRICPHMSAYVRKCPLLSAFLFRCKVTQKKIVTVQLCPAMSICVHLCPFMSSYGIATPSIYVAKLRN